jgi:ABC-type multidrug transport system fused ATPase/permease subunit
MVANRFGPSGELIRRVYVLARPFGRWKLAAVMLMSLVQGLFQVLGVTSVFPFLALASDPGRLRNSGFGQRFLAMLPEMSDQRLLLVAGLFAIAMLLASSAINLAAEFVRVRYAARFGLWLRLRMLRRTASRPYADFLQQNSGAFLKKVITDISSYVHNALMPLLDMSGRLATIIFLVAGLFLVHPQIALGAALVLGAFYAIVFRSFSKWRKRTSDALNRASRGSLVDAQQMLGGIKPVKVHRAEETFIQRFAVHAAHQARLSALIPFLTNGPRYLIEPLAFSGLVAIVLVYAQRGQDLAAILPNLGVMALAAYRLLPAFQMLYSQTTLLTTFRYSLDEVYDEFLAAETPGERDVESAGGQLSAPPPLRWSQEIRLEELTFKYPAAKRPVIDGLNLTIRRNTSLGIVGATGAGKSTLVDLILGLHGPTAGRILVDGTPLGPENRRAWRGGIGYVPQDIFLLDDTITANIAFGLPATEIDHDRVREVAAAAQILEFIESDLPEGFATVVGERGVRLSGGQRQRIGLARALYHRPELLILDEATSALDNETEQEVMKAIYALQGSVTMLIIAHRLTTIAGCQEQLDLGRG